MNTARTTLASAWLVALAGSVAVAQPAEPAATDAGTRAGTPPGNAQLGGPLLRPGQPTASTEPQAIAGDRGPLSFSVQVDSQIDFRTDLQDSPGDVAIYRVSPAVGVGYALSPQWRLGVDLKAEYSWYDFDGATGLIPGSDDPFSQTSTYTLSPSVGFGLDENWSFRAAALLGWSQEGSGPRGDGFTGGGLGLVRYKFSDDLAVSGGILATSRLEEDAVVIPIIGVEWQIDETLRFETRGLGAELSAKLTNEFMAFIDGGYNSREFRLEDDNLLPEGIVRDRRAQIGAGVRWQPAPFVQVSLKGGAIVWSEFRVDDRDGNELRSIDADPTGFVGLNAVIRF